MRMCYVATGSYYLLTEIMDNKGGKQHPGRLESEEDAGLGVSRSMRTIRGFSADYVSI